MAFNNGFPASYQPVYYAPQYQQAAHNNAIIWVSGEAGAKAYLVAPNTTISLWDSEAQTIYLKSADASGMPSMKVLDYTIRDQAPSGAPVATPTKAAEYATKDELKALTERIDGLRDELDSMARRSKDE